jgi:hypothetical protein
MSRPLSSYLLVINQFVILLLLATTGFRLPTHPLAWAMGLGGAALGGWALVTMRLDRISIMPEVQ